MDHSIWSIGGYKSSNSKVQLLTALAVVLVVSGFRLPPHVSPYGYYAKQGFIPVVPPVEMMDLYKVPFYLK